MDFLSIFAIVMNDEVSIKNACKIYTLNFPNAKNIVVSGDIHGSSWRVIVAFDFEVSGGVLTLFSKWL